ncbi:protein hit [Virgibacillus pantothenticus]|uniref:Protein hit n=1 Tax=Virgibacillus pantothenticus TaxID=1473 RepID=A0A0L0QTR2_VIRPA|nr:MULTISPECIES: HIT family protein [Virgibacillus]API91078.1 HIT family protein [Virgibacillus sp. 6R]KNE21966.1 protein hit [Virgibacillus pantothenticus]MBS7429067.1 HIT family protein [Virgibacillus sp. 19R1-5]MBU8566910.1 HIT family protein [Virgibacillus pantothenticus]MBU8600397.1 HIT family protein [Virgibacillus pantothenticus]
MSHEDCIFCKIVNQEIPSAKVYEDEHVYAFLDISQVTKGHTLIIPKVHVKNIYETPSDIAAALFARVPKIANAIKAAYQPIGMNLLNNNEKPADQSVFHLHIHLLPRYGKNDGFSSNWEVHADDYTTDDLQKIAGTITKHID